MKRYADFEDELVRTTLGQSGETVALELLIRRPTSPPPHPTVLFNHGAMGRGRKDGYRAPWLPARFARLLNELGWATILPQRRGVGRSEGAYGEGFCPVANEYLCDPGAAMAGFDRAMDDLDGIAAHVSARADVDARRLVIAGQSRGGALALRQAARHPDLFAGAFAFVPGWMGRGCEHYAEINRRAFDGTGAFPGRTLWMHGTRDRYYGAQHCRELFEAFRAEGGKGSFETYPKGHALIAHRELWRDDLERHLAACR